VEDSSGNRGLHFSQATLDNGLRFSLPENKGPPSHEDIRNLEDDIFELQEYNLKVESDISKMKSDITHLSHQMRVCERENETFNHQTTQLSEYYESLRTNFISLLDQVRLPNFAEEKPTPENFDSYLSKLQQLCVESYKEENRSIFSSVRQALQEFPISQPPTWVRS